MITSEISIDISNLRPLHDQVLLKRVELPESSVIVMPDIAKRPLHRGRVLRVGPGKLTDDGTRLPMQLKGGEMIWYMSADVDTGVYVIIQEADVLFIEG